MRSLNTIAAAATRTCCLLTATVLSLTLAAASATAAEGPLARVTPFTRTLPANGAVAGGLTCSGTPRAPGVLSGKYFGNVTVEGECVVDAGEAVVNGSLVLSEGSALLAAFGMNDVTHSGRSRLIVHGSVRVRSGASLLLGCEPLHFPCLDDPDPENATLSSAGLIYGTLSSREALGVVVHNSTIDGNVLQNGGGGGEQCAPQGVFEVFPVYSDYEDLTIGGRLSISNLESCWLGIARTTVGGKLDLVNDQLADPDAIEVLDNTVGSNLNCRNDSQLWDSADLTEELYPRVAEPNTVDGQRVGQCRLASPETEGGALGPGVF